MKKAFLWTCCLVCCCLTSSVFAAQHKNSSKVDSLHFYQWAATPPMGWNSWDCYGPTVTEPEVKANCDYMSENLKAYGWQYIIVDIRWYVRNTKALGYNQTNPDYCMDKWGRLIPADNKFPSAAGGNGFKTLADYVHSKGLKFGIHLMRGIPVYAVQKNTPIKGTKYHAKDIYSIDLQCKWLRDMYTIDADKKGAQEYYNSLFELYASWGVDYVKIDNLSRPYHKKEIELIRKAIDRCGRPMVLSTSPGATPLAEAEHVKTHANLWRICDDFWDGWNYLKPMFDLCASWAPYSGPGHWADADMLPLGRISLRGERGHDRMTRYTATEQYTLMTLWAIFRSPLMFGGDLPSMDPLTLSLLTNKEILALNQNSKNNHQIQNNDGEIVWTAEDVESGDKYVAFFNSNDDKWCQITTELDKLGLKGKYILHNLWTGKDYSLQSDFIKETVAPHGSAVYKLIPVNQ